MKLLYVVSCRRMPTLLSLIEDIEGISDMVSHFRIFHKRHTGNNRHAVPKYQLFNYRHGGPKGTYLLSVLNK